MLSLDDVNINNSNNNFNTTTKRFQSDIQIRDNSNNYNLVNLNRNLLAYQPVTTLDGYCNLDTDNLGNNWVTLRSPDYITATIMQKFPSLPGNITPSNSTKAVGDNLIEITSNGTYELGQNDADPDDLEMDLDNTVRDLTLVKSDSRDSVTTWSLGKFIVNVPTSGGGGGTTVNNADVDAQNDNEITSNGTFTVPSGYTGWNSFTVNVPTPVPSPSLIDINYILPNFYNYSTKKQVSSITNYILPNNSATFTVNSDSNDPNLYYYIVILYGVNTTTDRINFFVDVYHDFDDSTPGTPKTFTITNSVGYTLYYYEIRDYDGGPSSGGYHVSLYSSNNDSSFICSTVMGDVSNDNVTTTTEGYLLKTSLSTNYFRIKDNIS